MASWVGICFFSSRAVPGRGRFLRSVLHLSDVQVQGTNPLLKALPRDAEHVGGMRDISFIQAQRLLDHRELEIRMRLFERYTADCVGHANAKIDGGADYALDGLAQ